MLGAGTLASPFLIETVTDWEQVRLKPTSHYKLMNDLDFAGATYSPFNFSGGLDGNGHVLRNMVIRGNDIGNAIISNLNLKGKIKNLGVENIDSSSTNHTVATLVGLSYDDSVIEQCYSKNCTVKGTSSFNSGLVGRLSGNGIIRNCYSLNCEINGKNYNGSLVGNIAGILTCKIENSYSNNIITHFPDSLISGGLTAHANKPSANVINSYFDIEKAPPIPGTYENGYDGIPLTSAQMKQQSSYVGFDFDTVWGFAEYPYLKVFGEIAPPALSGEESVTGSMNPISSRVQITTKSNRIILVKSHLSPIESSSVSKYIPAPKQNTQSVTAHMDEIGASIFTKQSKTIQVSSHADKLEGIIDTKRSAIIRTVKTVTGSMKPILAKSTSKGKHVKVNYVSSYMKSLQGVSVSSIYRPYQHIIATTEVIVDGSRALYKVTDTSVGVKVNPSYTEVME